MPRTRLVETYFLAAQAAEIVPEIKKTPQMLARMRNLVAVP